MNVKKSTLAVCGLILTFWSLLILLLLIIDKFVMNLKSSLERSVIGLLLFAFWIAAWYYVSALIFKRKVAFQPEPST